MRVQQMGLGTLVIRSSVLRQRVTGTVSLLAATTVLYYSAGSAHQVIGDLAAFACLGITAIAWRGVSTQVVRFDRNTSSVQVRTQHIFGTSSVIHRLTDVADVVLERRPIGDGRDYFRPAFVMRNGTHQAWGTPAIGTARAEQIGIVRTLREFLGTDRSPIAPDGSVAIPRPSTNPSGWNALEPQQRRVARAMLGFTFVVSTILLGAGLWLAWTQHDMLTSYQPISAVVQSTDVVSTRDSRGLMIHRPSVRYTYRIDSQTYTSDAVSPLDESRTGDWAHRIVASYQPGQRITAYYNPAHPAHAYIQHTGSVLPLVLVAGSSLFLALATLVARP